MLRAGILLYLQAYANIMRLPCETSYKVLGHLTLYSLSLGLVGYKEYTPTHSAAGLCYVDNVVAGESQMRAPSRSGLPMGITARPPSCIQSNLISMSSLCVSLYWQ